MAGITPHPHPHPPTESVSLVKKVLLLPLSSRLDAATANGGATQEA